MLDRINALSKIHVQWTGCLCKTVVRECRLLLGGSQDARLGGRVQGLLTDEGIGWVASERAAGGRRRGRGE